MILERELVEHASGLGLQAARVWHEEQIARLHIRLESCLPDELGDLQGQIRLARKFLKILSDPGEGRPGS